MSTAHNNHNFVETSRPYNDRARINNFLLDKEGGGEEGEGEGVGGCDGGGDGEDKKCVVSVCDICGEAAILSLDDFISAVDEEEFLPPNPLDSHGQ